MTEVELVQGQLAQERFIQRSVLEISQSKIESIQGGGLPGPLRWRRPAAGVSQPHRWLVGWPSWLIFRHDRPLAGDRLRGEEWNRSARRPSRRRRPGLDGPGAEQRIDHRTMPLLRSSFRVIK